MRPDKCESGGMPGCRCGKHVCRSNKTRETIVQVSRGKKGRVSLDKHIWLLLNKPLPNGGEMGGGCLLGGKKTSVVRAFARGARLSLTSELEQ